MLACFEHQLGIAIMRDVRSADVHDVDVLLMSLIPRVETHWVLNDLLVAPYGLYLERN